MPSLKTLIVAGLLLGGSYYLQNKVRSGSAQSANGRNFVEVPWLEGAQRNQVLIIGPPCADKQRQMNEMVASLAAQNIPASTASSIRFSELDEGKIAASRNVFEGDVPIVFINGKAGSKPTIQEVIAEYRQSAK